MLDRTVFTSQIAAPFLCAFGGKVRVLNVNDRLNISIGFLPLKWEWERLFMNIGVLPLKRVISSSFTHDCGPTLFSILRCRRPLIKRSLLCYVCENLKKNTFRLKFRFVSSVFLRANEHTNLLKLNNNIWCLLLKLDCIYVHFNNNRLPLLCLSCNVPFEKSRLHIRRHYKESNFVCEQHNCKCIYSRKSIYTQFAIWILCEKVKMSRVISSLHHFSTLIRRLNSIQTNKTIMLHD